MCLNPSSVSRVTRKSNPPSLKWQIFLQEAHATLRACGKKATSAAPLKVQPLPTRWASGREGSGGWEGLNHKWLSVWDVSFPQDVAGVKGAVSGRVNSWMAKPAEAEKTPAAAPTPAPAAAAPAAASPATAKPAVRPDKSCSSSRTYTLQWTRHQCYSNRIILWYSVHANLSFAHHHTSPLLAAAFVSAALRPHQVAESSDTTWTFLWGLCAIKPQPVGSYRLETIVADNSWSTKHWAAVRLCVSRGWMPTRFFIQLFQHPSIHQSPRQYFKNI